MTSEQEGIRYRRGYKYQLAEAYTLHVAVSANPPIRTTYIDLDEYGNLTLHKGYAWDGPSGPTVDTKSFMRGALVHDGLYQLIYLGKLPCSAKFIADDELVRITKEDGMWSWRCAWVHWGVNHFGDPRPSGMPPILSAP